MLKGVAVGFLSYALFSSADTCIKALGLLGMPIFEILFFVTATSALYPIFPVPSMWPVTK